MGYFSLPLLLLAGVYMVYSASNRFDEPLDFNCRSNNQFINRIYSVHSNRHEDREFSFECKDIPRSVPNRAIYCYKTGRLNDYDEDVLFMCRPDYYINGMHSLHDKKDEDRAWRFTCCKIPDYRLHGCKFTGWTNAYDGVQNFYVEHGNVLTGVISRHDDKTEDRIFQYTTCKVVDGKGDEVYIGKLLSQKAAN